MFRENARQIGTFFAVVTIMVLVGWFILLCVERNNAYNLEMQKQGFVYRQSGWYKVEEAK